MSNPYSNTPDQPAPAPGGGSGPGQPPSNRFRSAREPLLRGLAFLARRAGRRWAAAAMAVALLLLAFPFLVSRGVSHASTAVALPKLPVVAAAPVKRADLYDQETITAEFRPFVEVELHAKVSGYVQEMNVDFGDKVKAGQLMARLEVPELKDDLDRALAAQKRAEADYHDAHLVYTRLLAVDQQHPNLVAQQELDTAEARDHTTEAAIAAARAEVEKNQTLLAYTRITAPFDGVVTRRYADPGALIQAGTASQTQSLPLVRVSDLYRLRLDFPVPLRYVADIQPGDSVEVRVDSLGNRSFTGIISRFTHQVDDDTRTMMTEIEVANPKLELVPGMYASVLLKVHKCSKALFIPAEAVSPENKATVYVIGRDGIIEERPVVLGLETATGHEVKKGLKEGELVLVGLRAKVRPGEKVEPRILQTLAQQ